MCSCRANTPAPDRFRYSRQFRLTRESDLERVKKAGRRLRTEHLEIRSSDSLLSYARVAVIVGKQGHTIVERNRLRRRLRELVRLRLLPRFGHVDIVLRAQPSAYKLSYAELGDELNVLISRLETRRVES